VQCKKAFLISIFIATLLLSSAPVSAEDPEFGLVVRQVESYFHVKRTHIPLLGFMKPVLLDCPARRSQEPRTGHF